MNEPEDKRDEQDTEMGPEELEKVSGGLGVSKVDSFTIKQKTTELDPSPTDVVSR
jgi:hypothetical protein